MDAREAKDKAIAKQKEATELNKHKLEEMTPAQVKDYITGHTLFETEFDSLFFNKHASQIL